MEVMEDQLPRGQNNGVLEVIKPDGTVRQRSYFTNSRTDAGALAMSGQMFGTAAQPAAFNFVAFSSNAALAPAKGDTVLSNEITTGALGRKQATVTYTTAPASLNATALTVVTATWTSLTAAGTIYGGGLFNAVSAGTLGLESTCTATTYNIGDTVNLTWNLNQ